MPDLAKTVGSLSVVVFFVLFPGMAAAAQNNPLDVWSRRSEQGAAGAIRITLPEAQARATDSVEARAARLSAAAARYHRQAVAADYFPKLSASFLNAHFNKFLGETISVLNRPIGLPLFNKDMTAVFFTATQPVTPILKIREAVNIARADERIAEARAAAASSVVAGNLEKAYFALLIAQRQLAEAQLKVRALEPQLQVVSTEIIAPPGVASERQRAFLEAGRTLDKARDETLEASRILNSLIDYPLETELELSDPDPLMVENVSLPQATQGALAANPEIVEAEQTIVKAKSAARLAKLDYIPDVAVMGGYFYQTVIPVLPADASFIGVVATFNLFDFGKREKTVKERATIVDAATLNLESVKAKVAGAAQKAYLDLERSARMRDITRQLVGLYHNVAAPPENVSLSDRAAKARAESEMARAELEYRLAYRQLKHAMGED